MQIVTKNEHIEFLRNKVLFNVKTAFLNEQIMFGFMTAAQAIEILGAYLDSKPLRAKQQSLKRFGLAISRLFPKEYYYANENNFLYYQLRACMTHFFIPTSHVSLNSGFSKNEKPHLSKKNGVLYLYSENFFLDFQNAVLELEKKILNNKIKLKPISIGEINESN